jgi:regulator of replication initiation timing
MFKEKEKQMSGEIQTLRTECEGIRKKYNESMTEADQKILNLTNREESLQKQLDMTIQSKREEESKM